MARNLVRETEKEAIPSAVEKKEEVKQDREIVILTQEQVVINNLNVIMQRLEAMENTLNLIYQKMLTGFKQVGVNFEEDKK